MCYNFIITIIIVCVTILLNIKVLDAKPFEISGKDFVYNKTEDNLGNYNFSYEDKIELANRTETGKIQKSTSGKDILVVEGSYATAFAFGDCQTLKVKYKADENGFRASFKFAEMVAERKEGEKTVKTSLCVFSYREIDPESNIRSDCIQTLTCGK